MNEGLIIRELMEVEEMIHVQGLEELVWGMDPVPYHQTFTAVKNGGIMLGAFKNNTLAGFLYSFPGFHEEKGTYLYSHMLGIHPEHRRAGLGEKLKRHQRELALKKGYRLITWTFDPLESVNAYLNLTKLRAIGAQYMENYYGNLDDSLNRGLPSDRFLAEWHIDSPHAESVVAAKADTAEGCLLLDTKINSAGFAVPVETSVAEEGDAAACYLAAIPNNFQVIKKEDSSLAAEWRMRTRKIISSLISSGYVAESVMKEKQHNRCLYVFKKKRAIKLHRWRRVKS
ncbi:GNAT family N-acetyltransferase [Evansella sp. LMS18]|uniref:GNAT family N-acetyltransferase n=1 Tax=Evansella sp. LMS18 TaxID=2924033 RepID=UPI0020D1E340|nr:GNAT family N-acetyltransferase [Evansella sp. LMS18]UTR09012.1 GNAT family N-acetyltransferase [Evansella sp. LMS18]